MGHEEERGPLLEGLRNVACKTHTRKLSAVLSLTHTHRNASFCQTHVLTNMFPCGHMFHAQVTSGRTLVSTCGNCDARTVFELHVQWMK